MPKPSISSAFPAFLLKIKEVTLYYLLFQFFINNSRKICILQAFPFFVKNRRNSCILLAFPNFFYQKLKKKLYITSFSSFLNDFQSIGSCPPPTARSHQNQQKLVKHRCFDIKMPKPLISQAFPAFLVKNHRKSCVLPAFPAF